MDRRDFLTRLITATAVLPLVRSTLTPAPVSSSMQVRHWVPNPNWIDLPTETGDIVALVPNGNAVLAFTERAIYRIDYASAPWHFDGRRFYATRMDDALTRVTTQQYR